MTETRTVERTTEVTEDFEDEVKDEAKEALFEFMSKLTYVAKRFSFREYDMLVLEEHGPYGVETFLLYEGHFDDEGDDIPNILRTNFSFDSRGQALACTPEGDILEPLSDQNCPICMEPCYERYKLKNNIRCGHQVCLKCLPDLDKCGGKCPLCRADLQ